MTEFRVKILPEQHYQQPLRRVVVYAGPDGKSDNCGTLTMTAGEAAAFAACFDELALSRQLLDEDALDCSATLRAQYLTARDRATEGTT